MKRSSGPPSMTPHGQRALELGADELHGRLEWLLRDRPRALRGARQRYKDFCNSTLRRIERTGRGSR